MTARWAHTWQETKHLASSSNVGRTPLSTYSQLCRPIRLIPFDQLSWGTQEGTVTWNGFSSDHIRSTPSDTAFFLATSFLYRREIPQSVFDALLSRKIVITPFVWGELRDWLASPFANSNFRDVLSDARERGHSSVVFLDLEKWGKDNGIYESVCYYTSLLSARKQIGLSLWETVRETANRCQWNH